MKKIGEWLAADRKPARTHGRIEVGTMASGAEVNLPFVALRGARPGKTLWLHGQVHGDEINGMVAALRFAASLDPAAMQGNLVVTPTGNPQALDARRKRNPYDELDLDQTYPGNARGLISERLARALFDEIEGVADVLINLHTMNPLFDSRPYTVYKRRADSTVDEAALFRAMAPFTPRVSCCQDVGGKGELPGNIAGALDYQCLGAGIVAFMLELGSGSRFEADNVALAERGFLQLARQMGIVDGAVEWPAEPQTRVERRGWLTAEHGGLFVARVRAGDLVRAGESIGDVWYLDGSSRPVPPLERDGILIGLRSDPVVHTGERLAFVAWQWDSVTVTR